MFLNDRTLSIFTPNNFYSSVTGFIVHPVSFISVSSNMEVPLIDLVKNKTLLGWL